MSGMETFRAPYAVRADHAKREYHVYDIATDKNVYTCRYTSEGSRAMAAGRVNMQRKTMNENARKETK